MGESPRNANAETGTMMNGIETVVGDYKAGDFSDVKRITRHVKEFARTGTGTGKKRVRDRKPVRNMTHTFITGQDGNVTRIGKDGSISHGFMAQLRRRLMERLDRAEA